MLSFHDICLAVPIGFDGVGVRAALKQWLADDGPKWREVRVRVRARVRIRVRVRARDRSSGHVE